MKKYYINTYGCQMNVHESEKIAGILKALDYIESRDMDDADLIVFNTCCIRDNAEKKVAGHIGNIKHLKEKKPNLIVVVCGCMTQQKGVAENLKKKFPYVDIILGSSNLYDLSSLVVEAENNYLHGAICVPDDPTTKIDDTIPIYRTSGTNAWVNIMYGCNNFCTYCIVPYVKGRERSRDPHVIINEVRSLIDQGYQEITLLGQNVDSYKYENYNFAYLLEEISKFSGKFRLRFMTSHPKDFNTDVIDIIKGCDNICNNIHLPFQSGSDRILKLMNRHYNREKYLSIINEIKSKLPNVGITTDVMVGFPTETDEDFEDTLSLIREVRFSNAFMFVYSPRNETPAAKMEQVPDKIKQQRITTLVDLQNKITQEISLTYVNKVEEVLVEDINPKIDNSVCGRTESGRLVTMPGNKELIGHFVDVKITSAKNSALWGEIVNGRK